MDASDPSGNLTSVWSGAENKADILRSYKVDILQMEMSAIPISITFSYTNKHSRTKRELPLSNHSNLLLGTENRHWGNGLALHLMKS